MYTIDEVQAMLCEIADELPDLFFRDLNGGIILQEECRPHPEGAGDLYVMGDYGYFHGLGRRINIYYGSFIRAWGHAPPEVLREKLKSTLLHEFTHHLENLAGEHTLEIKDMQEIEQYKQKQQADS